MLSEDQFEHFYCLLSSMLNLIEDMMWLCFYIFIYLYIVCIIHLFIYISSTLTVCSPNTTGSELYTTALSSPDCDGKAFDAKSQIAITISSTPNSTSLSPKKATLGRSESRTKKRKSFYELSPDISDKHVQLLEKNYGGKEKANNAARVIQQHYRNWSMQKTYCRLRTQSEARRVSMKGRLSKRNSTRTPSSSDSMSPTVQPLPLNFDVGLNELTLKSSEAEVWPHQNSLKDEFKPIQADINIDSNFGHVNTVNTGQADFSVRRVSEDISSIEINKNLLNDSIGQQMIIDEVFQQILSPRKDSISLTTRSDSLRPKRGEKLSIVQETCVASEAVPSFQEASEKTVMDEVDGPSGMKGTNGVYATEQNAVDKMQQAKVDDAPVEIVEAEQVEMIDEGPACDRVSTCNSLSVKGDQGTRNKQL